MRWSRGGVGVRRPPGDGHDQLWLKVTQFALVLPFTVGFRTNTCAWLIAAAYPFSSLSLSLSLSPSLLTSSHLSLHLSLSHFIISSHLISSHLTPPHHTTHTLSLFITSSPLLLYHLTSPHLTPHTTTYSLLTSPQPCGGGVCLLAVLGGPVRPRRGIRHTRKRPLLHQLGRCGGRLFACLLVCLFVCFALLGW